MSYRQILLTGSLCLGIAAASCTALNPAATDAGTGGALGSGGNPGSGGTGTGGEGTGGKGTGGAGTGGMAAGGSGMGGTAAGGNPGAGGSSSEMGCALIMHMDELSWNGTSNEVIDSCGHNNGTAIRAVSAADALPSTTMPGKYGRAGLFIDNGGCVEVPDDSSLHATAQLTVAAWIFPTGFNPVSNGIVGKRADYINDSSYTLFIWNNLDANYHLYTDVGNDRFNGSQSFAVNAWYHVAMVFDGTLPAAERVRLYVNGSLDGEFNESATSVPVFQTPVHVGCMPAGTPPSAAQTFIGKVDDVAIWTRALGAAEIMRLAQSTTPL